MSAEKRERCGLSRYRATTTLDGGIDPGDSALFDFFITACEAVFGPLEGYITRDEKTMRWGINSPSKVVAWLRTDEGKTDLRIDARMFKFWYFTIHIFIYLIVWNLFGFVMHFLGVLRIDPLVVPNLFLILSALRFGSIGACMMIVHLIFRSRRKRAVYHRGTSQSGLHYSHVHKKVLKWENYIYDTAFNN
jgi:hypothetical protein